MEYYALIAGVGGVALILVGAMTLYGREVQHLYHIVSDLQKGSYRGTGYSFKSITTG
jgi:hypothetical protein